MSGVSRFQNEVVTALNAGMCKSNIYRMLIGLGYKGGKTAASDYVSKVASLYGIAIPKLRNCTPEQQENRNNVNQFDYLTRNGVFAFLWHYTPLSEYHRRYLFGKYPCLWELKTCILEFRRIFVEQSQQLLYLFIEKYKRSNLKSLSTFAEGLAKDIYAVENAVSSPLSNGFVEGSNNKLKMVKRVMFGRCRRLLLEAKLLLQV